jgi:AraC-like DNA-binding protein
MPIEIVNGAIPLPLSERPLIRQAGTGLHGLKREERFHRPNLWALHLYFWEGTVRFGGQTFEIKPHQLGLTPPGMDLTWRFPLKTCPHYFVHFELSGEDAYQLFPIIHPLRTRFPMTHARVEKILTSWRNQRFQTEISLWDLLWDLSEENMPRREKERVGLPGAVETAIGIIDNEFDSGLNAETLAERIGVSYAHLNRMFQDHSGMSLGRFLTQKRLEAARHLLYDTDLAISTVAQMSGISNLQQFNKFVRRHCGMSPRELREKGPPEPVD